MPFPRFAPILSISEDRQRSRVLETALDSGLTTQADLHGGSTVVLGNGSHANRHPFAPPPKLFYATQAAVAPPTFVFFASDVSAVHFSYRRYLENRLRDTFGFDGTPIRLVFRDRASVKLPRRRKQRSAPVSTARGARRSPGGPGKSGGTGRPRKLRG